MSATMLDTIDILVRGDRANLAQFPSLRQLVKVYRGDVYVRQLFLEVIQGLVVVLQDHDFRRIDVAAQQLCHFFVQNSQFVGGSEERAISLSKYLLALPMSRYAQRTLIEKIDFVVEAIKPDGAEAFCPGGAFKRWINDHLYVPSSRNAQLWWSWFQVKRNTPTVDESFVVGSYVKHEKMLTRADPCPDGIARIFGCEFDPVELIEPELKQIASKVKVALDAHIFQAPSQKACFAYGQASGGQRRDVLSFLDPEGVASRELVSMDWFPIVRSKNFVYNAIVHTYARPDMIARAMKIDQLLPEETYSHGQFSELPCASIYGICEPLKVRIISKGPGVLYWRCKPLQKAIWSALKELPMFRLTGRPVDIIDVLDNTQKKFLASVDYSAATDGSSQNVGRRILEQLLVGSDISVNLMESALAAFGPHMLHYKFSKTSSGREVKWDLVSTQTNGQLMGSIMSFPILCLLNLATLRMAERAHGEIIVDPLINGDDMLFSCDDPVFWEYQCEAAKSVGLSPSLGKCYLSTHCFSINSVIFHRNKIGEVTRVEYLPTGLLHGKHKVACRDTTDETEYEESLASCFEVVCAGVRRAETASRFLTYNASKLNQECQGRNLFLPTWLGGIGVRCPDFKNWKLWLTPHQLKVADSLLKKERQNDEHCFVPRIGPPNRDQVPFTDHNTVVEHWTSGIRELDPRQGDWLWRSSKQRLLFPRRLKKTFSLRRMANAALGSRVYSPKRCDDPLNSSVPSAVLDQRVASRDCTEREFTRWDYDFWCVKCNATPCLRYGTGKRAHLCRTEDGECLPWDVQSRRAEGGLQNKHNAEEQEQEEVCEVRSFEQVHDHNRGRGTARL